MAGTSRKYPMLRRSRAMLGSRRVWQPRLVFWAGAVGIGVISVLFAVLADKAQALFQMMIGDAGDRRFYLPLIVTPLGFVLCAWLAQAFFPGSQGSGIPQAIAARHLRDDDDRNHLLLAPVSSDKPLRYLAGACWQPSGQFPDQASWLAYVAAEAARARAPVTVTLSVK